MGDFKNFKHDDGKAQSGGQKPGGGPRDAEQTLNLAATLAKAFAGKSEGQILSAIIEQAEQGKRDGTLTNADIDNFYRAVAPMLDGFRRKKLQQVVTRLKNL